VKVSLEFDEKDMEKLFNLLVGIIGVDEMRNWFKLKVGQLKNEG